MSDLVPGVPVTAWRHMGRLHNRGRMLAGGLAVSLLAAAIGLTAAAWRNPELTRPAAWAWLAACCLAGWWTIPPARIADGGAS